LKTEIAQDLSPGNRLTGLKEPDLVAAKHKSEILTALARGRIEGLAVVEKHLKGEEPD
jgi:hypothetical protein